MATFLVTPQMNPALRARVERAASHRTRARHNAAGLGLQGTFANNQRLRLSKILPFVAFALVAALGTGVFIYARRAVEKERAALLATLDEHRAGLPAGHERFLGVTDHFITETAGDTAPADVVDPALRAPGALDNWLRRPAVYVHGTAAALRDSQKIDAAAGASGKDPFLVCLSRPPKSASEADLLSRIRGVYFDGAKVDDETANVRRLTEARVGLSVLGPAFEDSARKADDLQRLRKLRKDLEAAPLEHAKKALAAELMIVAVDLPSPTNSREARVALMDLTTKAVLLRIKLHIDEQGRSPAGQLYRTELEGCALALAARHAVEQ
jgi:hypothetical protein